MLDFILKNMEDLWQRKNRATIMDIQNQSRRLAVAAYNIVVIACCLADLLPFDILGDNYYTAKELMTISVIGIALSCVSFDQLRVKGILFILFCWRCFVFAGNLLALETWIWPLFLFVAVILFVYLCFRVSLEKVEETNAPDSKIAAYALVPVHTYFGLFQKIFMFWHPPYETRVLVFDNYFWCVHRGRFMRFNRSAWKWSNKVRWVSIGRPLTQEEIGVANGLVGKRSIYGIKDCRKLMVAGNPKKYMRG